MKIRTVMAAVGAGFLFSCKTLPEAAPQAAAETPPLCVPMQTKVQFSCWMSPGAPLSHCVVWSEDEPRCGLAEKAGAYLNQGSAIIRDPTRLDSTWVVVSIYADPHGAVGLKQTDVQGRDSLQPIRPATAEPTPPRWPRWPAGREFGPEQVKR